MEDREVLETDAGCRLILQDAIDRSGKESQGNDFEDFHGRSIASVS